MSKPLPHTDPSWTLFLDRDGVINHEKEMDYIHTWDEFRFYDGVTEALRLLAPHFQRIVVCTNQRGVGKGLTKLEDLHTIHANMEREILLAGGRLDAVFYCTEMDNDSPYRKPNPGMGLAAARQFPEINLERSIMVGNTLSDMEFGRNLKAFTVFLPTTRPEVKHNDPLIDAVFPSLLDFARELTGKL
jgi:histidinol-phosphate phosphatase family protein